MQYKDLTNPRIYELYGEPSKNTAYILSITWSSEKNKFLIKGFWPTNPKINKCKDWSLQSLEMSMAPYAQGSISTFMREYWNCNGVNEEICWKQQYDLHGKRMPTQWHDRCNILRNNSPENFFKVVGLCYLNLLPLEKKTQIECHYSINWYKNQIRRLD